MILVVDRNDTRLRHDQGTVRVERPGEPVRRAPIAQLDLVVVYGNPLAETALWRALAAAGVPTVMLPGRGSGAPAVLANGLATQLPLRRLQHRLAGDPASRLAMARWTVRHKLLGYDLPLGVLEARHGLATPARDAFRARRDQSLAALERAATPDAVLGLEGAAAQAWFALLADTLSPAWGFAGRNRRPPRDPLNALLSLGYTLVGAEIHQGVMAAGLDPSLGFLHQPAPGREAMVLDLVEVFRGSVDHFALRWLDPAGPRRRDWYYREEEGCRLAKSARPRFYSAWAARRGEWPYPQRPPAPSAPAADAGEPPGEWPCGALREQIAGWIERLRAEMKTLVPALDAPPPGTERDPDPPFQSSDPSPSP